MSDGKTCEWCSGPVTREDGVSDFNWARRRFCSEKCRKRDQWQRRMNGVQAAPYSNRPITDDEIVKFVALAKSGMVLRTAAKQLGRRNASILKARAIRLGLLPKDGPVSEVAPVQVPKPMRVEPLPAGSPETWGAMMPGISWADAQRQIAQMGSR